MLDECTLLVLFVLQDTGKETIQAVLSVEPDAICSIDHIVHSDEDRLVLADTALFSPLAPFSPYSLLCKALHAPHVILGLLCCDERLFVTAKASMVIQMSKPELALPDVGQGDLRAVHRPELCLEVESVRKVGHVSRDSCNMVPQLFVKRRSLLDAMAIFKHRSPALCPNKLEVWIGVAPVTGVDCTRYILL
jgi:hypothetical protein